MQSSDVTELFEVSIDEHKRDGFQLFFFFLSSVQERGVQQIRAQQDHIPCGARRVSVQTAHVRRPGGHAQWRPQVIHHRWTGSRWGQSQREDKSGTVI